MNIQISEHFNDRKLIQFTLPTITMMIVTSVYGVVDGIFVSNCVGSDAFAAVNLILPAVMMLGAIGFMIGTGGSALVSMTLGEGRKKKANEYFSMLIAFVILAGIILTVVGLVTLRRVALLLGADGEILEECVLYGKVLLVALVPFMLQNCFQSFLVVAERPKLGLKISVAAGVTNMLLDFLFVYLFRWGVFGAAAATGLSQAVGGVIPLCYFLRPNNSTLQLVRFRFAWSPIAKSCMNGSSEMLTNLSMSLVNMLYNLQLMKFAGADGVAAYGIIMYVSFIFIGTYLGYSIGVAPIVGYHYGAGNQSELKSLLKRSVKLIGIAAFVLTSISELFAKELAGIFVSYDSGLMEMTTRAIRLFSISYLISGFNIFGSAFFTALNNGLVSALISFMRTLLFQIIMIITLPAIWGLDGIWLAIVAAEALALVVTVICFAANVKRYRYL